MICPEDQKCADNCGKIIKKGEQCVGVKEFYNNSWHKHYRCLGCQEERDDEQRREDAMASLD